jgi:hypothetical protein
MENDAQRLYAEESQFAEASVTERDSMYAQAERISQVCRSEKRLFESHKLKKVYVLT